MAAAHGEAVAERAAEREAAALRAGVSAARGERRVGLTHPVKPDAHCPACHSSSVHRVSFRNWLRATVDDHRL